MAKISSMIPMIKAQFHLLCKLEKLHKIQNCNWAVKSRSVLSAHACILEEISGHVKGGYIAAIHFTLDRNRISATAEVCPQRKFPAVNEFLPSRGVCQSISG